MPTFTLLQWIYIIIYIMGSPAIQINLIYGNYVPLSFEHINSQLKSNKELNMGEKNGSRQFFINDNPVKTIFCEVLCILFLSLFSSHFSLVLNINYIINQTPHICGQFIRNISLFSDWSLHMSDGTVNLMVIDDIYVIYTLWHLD